MVESFTEAMFVEQLNTSFRVSLGDRSVALELVQLTPLSKTTRQVQFSILFQGPGEPFLQQQIYRLAHDVLGEMDIFIVPVARNNVGFQYEAVFNSVLE